MAEKPQKKPQTRQVRADERLVVYLERVAAERINGWKTPAEILADDDCPLLAWLIPLYEQAVEIDTKRLKEAKKHPPGHR